MTSCIHLAGEAPLTHGYPTLLHWCCDAAPIKSTLASGYLAEGCFLTEEFTVVPGKICWETICRCYSIRMYHNVSNIFKQFQIWSCYFSRQPILRRIYQTGMRWSRLWERHIFSKGFTLVSGTRKSNASSLLVEPYTLPRYQGPIMGI